MKNYRPLFLLIMLFAILVVSACASAASQTSPTQQAVSPVAATPTPLSLQQLTDIQPKLGTVMIEYGRRFDNLWYAAQADNSDMARYQVIEMVEIQEVGETTTPARADALKAFENGFLNPLQDAITKKDRLAFEAAYDRAITGCNGCHAAQTSSDFPGGYKFVKVERPRLPATNNLDWGGQR